MPTLLFEQDSELGRFQWCSLVWPVIEWSHGSHVQMKGAANCLQQCSGTQNRSLCVVRFLQPCPTIILFYCCAQGRRCVLKDCCKILDNTVLPPETVVPPFTVFSGCPGRLQLDARTPWLMLYLLMLLFLFHFSGLFSGELPECTQDLMIDVTKSYYQKFLPLSQI